MRYLQRNKRASVLLAWMIVFTLLFTQSFTVLAAKPDQASSPGKSSSSQGSASSNASSGGPGGGSSAVKAQTAPASDSKVQQSAAESKVLQPASESKAPQPASQNKNTQNNGNASNIINKLKNPNALVKGITQAAITMAAITVEAITVDAIIVYKNQVDTAKIRDKQGKVNKTYKNIPAAKINIPLNKLTELAADPNVLSIEEDQIVSLTVDTIDWGTDRIQAPATWSKGYTGKGVKVAIVDTGVSTHTDLAIAGGANFTDYTSSYQDDNGHGTHVAGIAAAKNDGTGIVGAAPDALLYSVKVLGGDGSGYLSDVIAGVDWAIANDMDIVNLSLGMTTDSFALHQIVDQAYSRDVLVVAAAGNSGTSTGTGDTVNYPAKYSSVIAVGATDSSDLRASFSSTGPDVEMAAPGSGVTSTYLNGQYVKMSGTSMAAPYVTGQLALLKEAYPAMTAGELRSKLHSAVKDLGTSGKDAWYGYGLVQSFTAPEQTPVVAPVTDPIPTPTDGTTSPDSTKKALRPGWDKEKKNNLRGKSELAGQRGLLTSEYQQLLNTGDLAGAQMIGDAIKELDQKFSQLQSELKTLAAERRVTAESLYTSEEQSKFSASKEIIKKLYVDAKVLEVGSVAVKNNIIKFDTPAYIKGGRTIVPVRAIVEDLGAAVNYDAATRTVKISKEGIDILLTIDSRTVVVGGVAQQIDATTEITNGRTYVPLRFIVETFGLQVEYDPDTDSIDIGAI